MAYLTVRTCTDRHRKVSKQKDQYIHTYIHTLDWGKVAGLRDERWDRRLGKLLDLSNDPGPHSPVATQIDTPLLPTAVLLAEVLRRGELQCIFTYPHHLRIATLPSPLHQLPMSLQSQSQSRSQSQSPSLARTLISINGGFLSCTPALQPSVTSSVPQLHRLFDRYFLVLVLFFYCTAIL